MCKVTLYVHFSEIEKTVIPDGTVWAFSYCSENMKTKSLCDIQTIRIRTGSIMKCKEA